MAQRIKVHGLLSRQLKMKTTAAAHPITTITAPTPTSSTATSVQEPLLTIIRSGFEEWIDK